MLQDTDSFVANTSQVNQNKSDASATLWLPLPVKNDTFKLWFMKRDSHMRQMYTGRKEGNVGENEIQIQNIIG